MYQLKYTTAFCSRFAKNIEISYIHISETDLLIGDGHICAEAKLCYTCLEKDTCLEKECSQNNFFGRQFLQLR